MAAIGLVLMALGFLLTHIFRTPGLRSSAGQKHPRVISVGVALMFSGSALVTISLLVMVWRAMP